MFLLNESIEEVSFNQFQLGIDDLILIEKKDNDFFYKNSGVVQLKNYFELYQKYSQENQFRSTYLEQLSPSESNPKSVAELSAVFPNKISGFFGINFPQLDIDEKYCIQNNKKFTEFKSQYVALIDNNNFSYLKEDCFPNIIFCPDAEDQLKYYGTGKYFSQCISQFRILDNYLMSWKEGIFQYQDLNDSTAITISPESRTTMGKHGAERVFTLPNGGTAVFELHIKLGDIRIHILEDNASKKIMIGYIGKHLTI